MSARAVSGDEVAVIRWLLAHAAVGDVSAYGTEGLDGLRARSCCDTCAGLIFGELQAVKCQLQMLADALAVYPDGQVAGILLWGSEGEFAWLELHDTITDGTARRFPVVSDLRTWEQHGEQLARAGK